MSFAWYKEAAVNLGISPLPKLQIGKKLHSSRPMVSATSKHLDHPVWYRNGTSDAMVFNQIFVEREYQCVDDLSGLDLIVDCGANVGYSSAYFLSRHPDAFVVAVEPDAGNYEMLRKNLAPYGDRALALHGAVWSCRTRLNLNQGTMARGVEWGRTVAPADDGSGDVEAYDMQSLLAMTGRRRIALLKMDIEGAEKEVFGPGHEPWLAATDNFVIEVHGPECDAAVRGAAERQGFALSTFGELTIGRRAPGR